MSLVVDVVVAAAAAAVVVVGNGPEKSLSSSSPDPYSPFRHTSRFIDSRLGIGIQTQSSSFLRD